MNPKIQTVINSIKNVKPEALIKPAGIVIGVVAGLAVAAYLGKDLIDHADASMQVVDAVIIE